METLAPDRAGGADRMPRRQAHAPSLPPELEHVLAACPPATGSAARAVLETAMADRLADGSASAWRGSRLTGDGFPVEVSFTTADDGLRLTVEAAASAIPAGDRLAVADAFLAAEDAPLPPSWRERIVKLQRGLRLRYGAWIGCRFNGTRSEFKLYAEVPDGRSLGPEWHQPLTLPDRPVVPRMVAVSLADLSIETYVRVPSMTPEHVPAVLDPVGLADRSDPLLEMLEESRAYPLRGLLPGESVGVSYVNGPMPRVTLFFYARSVWGGDARIRRAFIRVADRLSGDCAVYERVSAPLADRDEWRTYHGLIGITVSAGADPVVSIGLRPIAPGTGASEPRSYEGVA